MTLYVYKIGTSVPTLTIENVISYTDTEARMANGGVYRPFAEDCELSSLPDCSETLRADWRAAHPSADIRAAQAEAQTAKNAANIDYLSMMAGIDLPGEEDADNE